MNKRRKSIAIALACAMLVGTIATTVAIPGSDVPFGITVSAAEIVDSGSCGENLTYTIDNEGTLTISGTGEMKDYESNESPFYNNTDIENIMIEDGVTSIGSNAFWNCSSIESITIPDGVTNIGNGAFRLCTSLTSVTIPNSVASIGNYVFSECESLTSITIPDGVSSIEYNAFGLCSNLTSIIIPNSVTSIGRAAFCWCTSLESIIIPDGVTSIGDWVFMGCESLTSITIPDSVTNIGDKALGYSFDYRTSSFNKLPGFTITGYSGSEAERYANDNGFKFLLMGETDIIDSGSCGENVNYTLDSDGTLTISGTGDMNNYEFGESPFFENSDIKKIIIEDGVTSIGSCAFMQCSPLTSVTLPDGVTSIRYGAFDRCTSLTSINIPDTMTDIGTDAFCDCTALRGMTLPDSVTSIGEHAFGYLYNYDNDEYEKQPGFTITGYPGTEAERYANDNGFEFIPLSVPVFTLGDVNGDGSIDIADSLFVARADAGLATLTDAQKQAADVNKDGSADIADALFIARVDAGLASL